MESSGARWAARLAAQTAIMERMVQRLGPAVGLSTLAFVALFSVKPEWSESGPLTSFETTTFCALAAFMLAWGFLMRERRYRRVPFPLLVVAGLAGHALLVMLAVSLGVF